MTVDLVEAPSPSLPEMRRPVLWDVAVVLPPVIVIVGWAILAARAGWQPVGDDAVIGIRAGDVFSRHPPLLGMPSSFVEWSSAQPHHPGPLLFVVLAPFVAVLGGSAAALLVGVVVVNTASVALVAVAAHRRLGRTGAGLAMAGILAILPALGLEPYEPLNPVLAFLPFTAAIFCAWGVVVGDRVLLPYGIATASFALQADLSYAVAATVLLALMLGVVARAGWRQRRFGGRAADARSLVIAGGVLLSCWTLPAMEAAVHGGGNVVELLRAVRTPNLSTSGAAFAGHTVTSTLNGSWLAGLLPQEFTAGLSWLGVVVAAASAVAIGWAIRRRSTLLLSLLGTAALAVAAEAWATSRTPVQAGVQTFYILPAAATAMAWWFSVAVALHDFWRTRATNASRSTGLRIGAAVFSTLILIPYCAGLLGSVPSPGAYLRPNWPAVPTVAQQLERLPSGIYEIRALGGPPTISLLHGIVLQVDRTRHRLVVEPGLVNYVGPEHAATAFAEDLDGLLYLATGPPGVAPVAGARTVARWMPPSTDETELRSIHRQVAAAARRRSFSLNDEAFPFAVGTIMAATGVRVGEGTDLTETNLLNAGARARADPSRLLDAPDATIATLYAQGLVASPALPGPLERRLDEAMAALPVTVYLVPPP